MKKFWKYTFATVVGFIITNIILFVLGLSILLSMAGSDTVTVKNNSILEITFRNAIQDRNSNNPFESFDIFSMSNSQPLGLNQILETIKKASKDERIKGIYLNLTDIRGNFGAMASIEEIRNALNDFKKSGKFIYSYSNLGYSQKAYYLATVADSVFVNPETPLGLIGLSSYNIFLKNTLDKLGIKNEIFKVGKYKSAVEPFIQTEMSKENREQVERYLNSTWGTMLKSISEGRNLTVDQLNSIADQFDMRTPQEEAAMGLFDGVFHENHVIDLLKTKCGLKVEDKLPYITLEKYIKAEVPSQKKNLSKNKIAVIYATGEIVYTKSRNSIGPELAETIRNARKDKNIKAIVMRVNSPGGSALTSDIIWKEVQLAVKEKPFVVSMGNVAASGGYYISCAANTIVADPTTLTGSIGVFGLMFSGEKLIKDKIGITTEVVKTNKRGDFGGVYPLPLPISDRPLNAYERKVIQKFVEHTYDSFLDKVAEGRNLSKEAVHEIAQGRVWTGEDALSIGLVDELGGLNDAIRIAVEKAELEEYRLVELPIEKNPIDQLFSDFSASVKENTLRNELGGFYETYQQLKGIAELPQGVLARVPYNIVIE